MRARLGNAINLLLLLVITALLAYLSTRWSVGVDATAGARASLPAATQVLLEKLPGSLEVTCYASPASGLRPTVAAFIARYRRDKPDLSLRFVDPEQDPGAMRQAGIDVDGEMVLSYQGHTQHLEELSDIAFGNALARLSRGGERVVAFVSGDGERRADGKANADLGAFVGQLAARGLRAVPLDFSQTGAVPGHTDLVVLASPLVALAPAAVKALVDYVEQGGNLLWLAEPDNRDLGLAPLAATLDLRFLPGVLVDDQGAALGLKDPRLIAVQAYPPGTITRGFSLTTVYPQARALTAQTGAGWHAGVLLQSGAKSWNETTPIDNAHSASIRYDAGSDEQQGPLAFGFTLTRLSPSPLKREQRVVVIGDGDFLSNSFLGNGGNRALGERVFDWLLGDDVLAALPPRAAPDRRIALTQTRLNGVAGLYLLLLPLLLAGFGVWRGWRRYRR
ncbi:MAG TPA: DUF4350 domain-containing protein [Rhodanobacteraceae bacterium]|nr:DUF4350 domain-containing protein [Rhodanobacteraceae bacterium]